jgi:hypothetical protein
MSRMSKFNLLTLIAFAIITLLLACVAHAQGSPDPTGIATSPNVSADDIATMLSLGAYGAATLGFIELAEIGLLWLASRPGSRLRAAVPYLSAGAGITATALATLVARGQSAELRAVPMALMVAIAAYYTSPAKRDAAADTLPIRKDPIAPPRDGQGGLVTREIMMPIVAIGLMAIGVAMLLALLGCGPRTTDTLRQVEHAAIDCGKAQIAPTAIKLVAGVEAIAMGVDNAPDRTALLDTLVAGAETATACALLQAAQDLAARMAPAPGEPKVEGQEVVGLERVQSYIKARGFHYLPAGAQ